MPTYEYTCTHCNHGLEIRQGINDPVLTECPQCHEATLERLISMTSFHLKGKGWYRDEIGSSKASQKTKNSTSESTTTTE